MIRAAEPSPPKKRPPAGKDLTAKPAGTQLLANYEAMCTAIDQAYRVDEVKDIRDKALALEFYAKQAKNVDAESRACQIRLRAERKAGALLKLMAKSKERQTQGGSRKAKSLDVISNDAPAPAALKDLGISANQSSRWQKLADVPQEKFEQAIANPAEKPSTGKIIRENPPATEAEKPKPVPIDRTLLWVTGRLLDFEERGIVDLDPASILNTVTSTMVDDVVRITPKVVRWLQALAKEIEHAEVYDVT